MEESKEDSEPMWDRIKLLYFADKYYIEDLTDSAMDTIIDGYRETSLNPSAAGVFLAYSNTSKGSGIRLYMARSFAYLLIADENLDYSEECIDILANLNDFSRDVFSMMMHRGDEERKSPDEMARCDYRHGKDKACPQFKPSSK